MKNHWWGGSQSMYQIGIKEWWDEFLGYKIREFRRSVKNIIRWFPIIWKDRDWDDSYIFEVLKHKIKFTAEYTKKRQFYNGWKREVELMELCVKLIERIQNEYYQDLAHDYINNKYGKSEWEFLPIPGSTSCSELILKHKNIENGTYTEADYTKEFRDKTAEAYAKQEKARKLLFRILHEHILRWWD